MARQENLSVEEYMDKIMQMVDMSDLYSIPMYQFALKPAKWRMYANGVLEAKNEGEKIYARTISKFADWLLKWGDKLDSCQDDEKEKAQRILCWIKDFLFVLIISSNSCSMSSIFLYTYKRIRGSIFLNSFYWLLPFKMRTEMILFPQQLLEINEYVDENFNY